MDEEPKTWPRGWALAAVAAAFLGGRWSATGDAPAPQPVASAAFVSPAAEAATTPDNVVAALEAQADLLDAAADADPPAEPVAYVEPEREVYYQNCSAARAAGAAPVMAGAPGYAPHLDRDKDGVGCE